MPPPRLLHHHPGRQRQRSQSYERENDRHRFSNEFVEDVTIKFLSDGRIDVTSKSAVIDAKGRTPGESGHFVLSLDKPTDINLRGEGKRIYVFENSSLVFLRTYNQGGMKRTISFKKTNTGFACDVDVAMMRENGTGPIRLRSATAPVMLRILSAKQTSSMCTVK